MCIIVDFYQIISDKMYEQKDCIKLFCSTNINDY